MLAIISVGCRARSGRRDVGGPGIMRKGIGVGAPLHTKQTVKLVVAVSGGFGYVLK